uniref:DUF4365 domain-containing protein n=2 Tax=Anaerofustis TaxID=264995 RepID=UPI001106B1E8
MSLDKKTIETLSVNAVEESVVTSGLLDSYINENDKEPSWDGAVYIYKCKKKTKENLRGRMPVQVKGKECNDHSKKTISFSIPTVDLKNYLNDGGCMFFVVYIGNNGLTKKIYYDELTPIKLRQILSESKKQKNKSLHLKEFPVDNNEKNTVFLNCLQNCEKQKSFKDCELFSLDELTQKNVLEDLFIPVEFAGKFNLQTFLLKNDFYIYAKIKGSSVLHPINIILKNIHTHQIIDGLITIDDKVFYKNFEVEKTAIEKIIHIGESFSIHFIENSNEVNFRYNNSKKLSVLVHDLNFFLTYIEKGYFNIDNVRIPFNC